jgi:hypothetical protein
MVTRQSGDGSGIGAEIVLTMERQLRKTRLFRSQEQAELVSASADTRAMFEGEGVELRRERRIQ